MPAYNKTIVCLANSDKNNARCIAGIEVFPNCYGDWVRPVSPIGSGEIVLGDRRYENGGDPGIFDVVQIEMLRSVPKDYQTENHLIDRKYYWTKVETLGWQDLNDMIDTPSILWVNGNHSYNGTNDRIDLPTAKTLQSSLALIKPEKLAVGVGMEGQTPKKSVRANFTYNGVPYALKVTDPIAKKAFLAKPNGSYPLKNAYLCVSLGGEFKNDCYKLVAAIICKEPF